MSLTKLTENLNNVSSLPDKPSLQAEELKQEFDKAGNSIKEYINAILTEEIDKIITNLTNRISTNESNISDNTENIENANTNITKKAPTSHASSATTYGVGTTSNYGHCKLANSLTTSSHTDGVALSAYQGKVLNTKFNNYKLKGDFAVVTATTNYGGSATGGVSRVFSISYPSGFNSSNSVVVSWMVDNIVNNQKYLLEVYSSGMGLVYNADATDVNGKAVKIVLMKV